MGKAKRVHHFGCNNLSNNSIAAVYDKGRWKTVSDSGLQNNLFMVGCVHPKQVIKFYCGAVAVAVILQRHQS
jgi:hypothetical protein